MTARVEYFRIAEDEPLPDISAYRPFKAVVVSDATVSTDWQDMASKWLVESGCLYMMAWGRDCSGWEDSVDWANIGQFPGPETPDEQLVMTTSHNDEPLKEVFWYARICASHPDADLAHALIIHVSSQDARDDMLACYEVAGSDDYLPE